VPPDKLKDAKCYKTLEDAKDAIAKSKDGKEYVIVAMQGDKWTHGEPRKLRDGTIPKGGISYDNGNINYVIYFPKQGVWVNMDHASGAGAQHVNVREKRKVAYKHEVFYVLPLPKR
jgi:hypothetical protein